VVDPEGDPEFYAAYYYLNTLFLCLASTTFFIALAARRHDTIDFVGVDVPALFMCSLMTITQYVVVPYDALSYFLLAAGAFIVVTGCRTQWATACLCAVVVLATLTRETAVLIPALHVAINHRTILTSPIGCRLNRPQVQLVLIAICFLSTYVILRIALREENILYQSFRVAQNFSLLPVLSTAFFAGLVLLVVTSRTAATETIVFLVVSFPYILAMFLIARLWEIRLWVPVVLLLVLLQARGRTSPATSVNTH
jgi:hypothetical protein